MEEPRFAIGDLVRHPRLNYRGVVYEVDLTGGPPDLELTDPVARLEAQEMPWYRVLVHGGSRSAQVAESELEPDEGGEQVANPRVKQIFESFSGGRYAPRIL